MSSDRNMISKDALEHPLGSRKCKVNNELVREVQKSATIMFSLTTKVSRANALQKNGKTSFEHSDSSVTNITLLKALQSGTPVY